MNSLPAAIPERCMLCYETSFSEMKNIYYIVLLLIFLSTGCNRQANIDKELLGFNNITKYFIREIPTNPRGKIDAFFASTKEKQKLLGLESLENGFDGLQIRIWFDVVNIDKQKLVNITYKNLIWTTTVYDLITKTKRILIPKSGWINLSNNLLNLKILTLPNGDEILNCGGGGGDGSTYNIEIATINHYRYYSYWEPQLYTQTCWLAKNIKEVLSLITKEFVL